MTSGLRNGRRLLHQTALLRMARGPDGKPASTNSAEADAAEDVFDVAGAELSIDGFERGNSAERAIGAPEQSMASS
jgi:hypothetical protein